MLQSHTDRAYESELLAIRSQVIQMGEQVCQMLKKSVTALVSSDGQAAREVIGADRTINRLELEIDELCLRVLARRQPVAADLRFIATALKMDTDLERIGDLCVNVCERGLELNDPVPSSTGAGLAAMERQVAAMIQTALRAFEGRDITAAQQVIAADLDVDRQYGEIFGALLEQMRCEPASVYAGTRLQAVAKYIERMGDHATNLAEMVIFMVHGQDVRHPGRLD